MSDLKEFLFSLERKDFWDPSFGLGLLAGRQFDDILRELLGCQRFEETMAPIQIAVFELEHGDLNGCHGFFKPLAAEQLSQDVIKLTTCQ